MHPFLISFIIYLTSSLISVEAIECNCIAPTRDDFNFYIVDTDGHFLEINRKDQSVFYTLASYSPTWGLKILHYGAWQMPLSQINDVFTFSVRYRCNGVNMVSDIFEVSVEEAYDGTANLEGQTYDSKDIFKTEIESIQEISDRTSYNVIHQLTLNPGFEVLPNTEFSVDTFSVN